MSQTGTVKSWKRVFGFAETADGTFVYIHQDEIDGGRLRVGRTVTFDTEKVEGHEGRVKGTNVSGEAILKKGEKLSDEDFAADKKIIQDAKDARKAEAEKEADPLWAEIEGVSKGVKFLLLKKLAKELKLDEALSQKTEDKRPDPTTKSKQTYTKAEFIAFYGKKNGDRMWALAGKKGGKKGGKNGGKPRAVKKE